MFSFGDLVQDTSEGKNECAGDHLPEHISLIIQDKFFKPTLTSSSEDQWFTLDLIHELEAEDDEDYFDCDEDETEIDHDNEHEKASVENTSFNAEEAINIFSWEHALNQYNPLFYPEHQDLTIWKYTTKLIENLEI